MAINGGSHKLIVAAAAEMAEGHLLDMALLGNQVLRNGFRRNNNIKHADARDFYAEADNYFRTVDVICEDAELLGKPQKGLFGKYDIVFNGSVLESVKDQKQAWRNVHYFAKEGGVMVHVCALMGLWEKHEGYLYHPDFFATLAEVNGYEILAEDVHEYKGGEVVMISLRKTKSPFYWSGCDEFIEDRSK